MGAPLFALEHAFELAAVSEAEHGLQRARNNQANLEKGQRPSEIAAIQALLRKAKASADLARLEYERRVKLIAEHTISQEELDRAKSDYDQQRQAVRQTAADLTTARLGARSDEIRAAEAEVLQAQAKLDQARWNLDQKEQTAPADGFVFDTLYRVGEWVGGRAARGLPASAHQRGSPLFRSGDCGRPVGQGRCGPGQDRRRSRTHGHENLLHLPERGNIPRR